MIKIEADLHVHTLASGHAYSTVKENVEAAYQKGLKTIAITDHGLNMPGAPHVYHFTNMISIPRVIEGVQVLRGVEANIIDVNGNLDMPEEIMSEYLDIVLAGFHDNTGFKNNGSIEENTEAMVNAIKNPFVHIITHPGNPSYPVEIETVIREAKDYHKAIELNNSSFIVRPNSKDFCIKFAKLAKKYNVLVSLNSDAHICYNVGEIAKASQLAMQEGIHKSQIINSTSNQLHEFLTFHKNQIKMFNKAL